MDIKDIFRTLIRRKWWFIAAFIIVVLIGIFLMFLKTEEFKSTAVLGINEHYNNELAYIYFPDESEKLGIYSFAGTKEELEIERLKSLYDRMRQDIVYERALKDLDISAEELKNIVNIGISGANKNIRIEVIDENPKEAFKINQAYLDAFLEVYEENIEDAYNELLIKIDNKLTEIESKDNGETSVAYQDLSRIKFSLQQNEDIIKNQINIVHEPNIPEEPINVSNKRNIALILLIAIGLGIIVTYLPDIFINLKKQQ